MNKNLVSIGLVIFITSGLIAPALASTFEMEHPSDHLTIDERVGDACANEEAAVGIGVHIHEYLENALTPPWLGRDGFSLRVVGTANTRKGIYYMPEYDCDSHCFLVKPELPYDLEFSGDYGGWITLPFDFSFYGGPGIQNSSIYSAGSEVWVSKNGFLCFEGECGDLDPPVMIHDGQWPNAFIAPYWANLNPSGGSIKWGPFMRVGTLYFGVEWQNVLDEAKSVRQTFAFYTSVPPGDFTRKQNVIILEYWDVTQSSNAIWGIEDQEGFKGYGMDSWPNNLKHIKLIGHSSFGHYAPPEIREMSIKLEKEDANAEIYIDTSNWNLASCNLQWESPQPAPEPWYEVALKGGATLLMSVALWEFCPVCGLLFDIGLITYETCYAYSKSLWQAKEAELENADTTQNLAYVKVPAAGTEGLNGTMISDWPVDSTLGAQIYWIFTDDNIEPHAIDITVELKYYSYDLAEERTISTTVHLNVPPDAGNRINEARYVTPGEYLAYANDDKDQDDFYNVTVPADKFIHVTMTPPAEDANFDLYLYNAGGYLIRSSTKAGNATEYVWHGGTSTRNYFIQVNAVSGEGLYKLEIEVSSHGSGGGCPFVYAWNGQEYVIDNNLLPASEVSGGADVDDYYRLEQTLFPTYEGRWFSSYSLQIGEFENEHSYIDQVKLLAVDHESDVNVAVTPTGEIVTYRDPHVPVSCTDKCGDDVLKAVEAVDDNYYQGYADDYLILDFGSLDVQDGAKLVMRADQKDYYSINVQVLDSTQNWTTVATVHPRALWATEIVDLSYYLPDPNGNLKVRLYFTAKHKLDYAGLDTTLQADTTIRRGLLVSAKHSQDGTVTSKLLFNDENYAELVPSQQIELTFILPNNSENTRTFILYTNGYYHTITPENP